MVQWVLNIATPAIVRPKVQENKVFWIYLNFSKMESAAMSVDISLRSEKRISVNCMTAWQLPDRLFDGYRTTAWRLPGNCRKSAWLLIIVWCLACFLHKKSWNTSQQYKATTRQVTRQQKDKYSRLMRLPAAARSLKTRGVCHSHGKRFENSSTYYDFMINSTALGLYPTRGQKQRYTYRVLQTIQMKLILLCVWAEPAILGSTKTVLKFKYEI